MMMKWFLIAAGLLHLSFMLLELVPWKWPLAIRWTSSNLPSFTPEQQHFVRGIVQNAGIYNGIVAGGLFFAAYAGTSAADVARVLLIGAAAAGTFGALTLKSPYLPALQALVGAIGAILVGKSRFGF
jgi:putative membrane protein